MPRSAPAALVAAVLLLAACADDDPPALAADEVRRRPDPASAPVGGTVDDPADGAGSPDPFPARRADGPVEVVLEIPVGELPDGTDGTVTVRSVAAGGRREVVVDTPAGVVDRHVFTDDEHWWWITPLARDVVDVEWVHLDRDDLERAGDGLPGPVADARVALPEPGDVRAGMLLADHQVVAVRRVGPDEDRIEVEGLDGVVVLRRRALPAGHQVEVPERATPLRDLPELLAG